MENNTNATTLDLQTTTSDNAVVLPSKEDIPSLISKTLAEWTHGEAKLAPLLYRLWCALRAQGKKGQGFDAWLRANKKSRSTAYRLIRAYADAHDLEGPKPRASKPKPSTSKSSKSAAPQHSSEIATPDDVKADYMPIPASIVDVKHVVERYFDNLNAEQRNEFADELVEWSDTLCQMTQGSSSGTMPDNHVKVTIGKAPLTAFVASLPPEKQLLIAELGTLAGLLEKAKTLVETPQEQFRTELDTLNSETHELVMADDPRFTPFEEHDFSAEIDRVNAYLKALGTALYQLNTVATQVRNKRKAVEGYRKRLEDQAQPLCRAVPKKPSLAETMGSELLKELA